MATQGIDRDALTIIAWGTRTPTAIEQTAGTTRSSEDWPQQLDAIIEPFDSPRWPANYLRRYAVTGTKG